MRIINRLKKKLISLFELIFPRTCGGCKEILEENEKVICLKCKLNLPFIELHSIDIAVRKKINVTISSAFSLLFFQKDNLTQKLIHNLKYNGVLEIGEVLGKLLGKKIKNSISPFEIEAILPIPLHKKRLKKRGYNQTLPFARGLSKSLGIEIKDQILSRQIHKKSQAFKNKEKRLKEIRGSFKCEPAIKKFSHILLIDDVLTTGATLEDCAKCILEQKNLKISIATLAYAI